MDSNYDVGILFRDIQSKHLYPTVGFALVCNAVSIRANFGQNAFSFNLSNHESSKNSNALKRNEHFVSGRNISAHVALASAKLLLGPETSARRLTYGGEQGYMVTTPNESLTSVSRFLEYTGQSLLSLTLQEHIKLAMLLAQDIYERTIKASYTG